MRLIPKRNRDHLVGFHYVLIIISFVNLTSLRSKLNVVVHQISWTQHWHWKKISAWGVKRKQEREWKKWPSLLPSLWDFPTAIFSTDTHFTSCPMDWVKERSMSTPLLHVLNKVHNSDLSYNGLLSPHFHCLLFFRLWMFSHFLMKDCK